MSSTAKKDLTTSMDEARRPMLIEHAVKHPTLSIDDLISLDDDLGDIARSITMKELVDAAIEHYKRITPKPKPATAKVAEPSPKQDSSGELETRTAEGRQAYDDAVLGMLKSAGDPQSATQVRTSCGGTPAQARASLNRLIEQDLVTYTGKARGTLYSAI